MSANETMTLEESAAWLASLTPKERADFDASCSYDGVCFNVINGKLDGPYKCQADADRATERMVRELEASGVDVLSLNLQISTVFGDALTHHMPEVSGDRPNG
jgi:hypothetical protein